MVRSDVRSGLFGGVTLMSSRRVIFLALTTAAVIGIALLPVDLKIYAKGLALGCVFSAAYPERE